jgi:hypothetical protein
MEHVKAAVAVLAIIGFGAFVVYLVTHIGVSEQEWTRAAYVFGGVEAIAFAAVGWFFGKEVNRSRAEKAEARADTSDAEAVKATAGAAASKSAGEALTAAILAKLKGSTMSIANGKEEHIGATLGATPRHLEELAALAKSLFPETRGLGS